MIATIGGFDGMHIAHQELIKRAQKLIIIEKGSNLTPDNDRCDYTNLPCVFYKLEEIKHLLPLQFIELLKNQDIKKIVIGEDFRFGKDKQGGIALLKKHFEVEVIKEIKLENIPVHSRVIREFIKNKKIKKANKFLGHLYKIKGKKIKGQGLGSKKLVPTINIKPIKNYLIPPNGVYITLTNKLPSLTFIGIRSTDNNFSIETYILNDNFIKDNLIIIEFLDFLRENKAISNLEELKRLINNDIKKATKQLEKLLHRL